MKWLPFNQGNTKTQIGVAVVLVLLIVGFATKCAAGDGYTQIGGGSTIVRGTAPAIDLSFVGMHQTSFFGGNKLCGFYARLDGSTLSGPIQWSCPGPVPATGGSTLTHLSCNPVAAQAMRHILVDHARTRHAAKRGGAVRAFSLDEAAVLADDQAATLVALDDALKGLAQFAPRQSQVIELRYFGGLSVKETAEVLKVSAETVTRDLRMAKAWLLREMEPAS